MRLRLLPLIALCALLLPGAAALAGEKVVRLTSLDWPPYTSPSASHGVVEQVVRQAFKAMGYTLVTEFFPFNRAVANGLQDPQFAGYYPEYRSQALASACLFSDSIGGGPLGFAQRKAHPVAWKSLDDLAGVRIGTVLGYVNTNDFDARVKAGRLTVDEAKDDAANLKKLAMGRVDLAVVDRNVMAHLLATDQSLAPMADQVEFHPRLLEDKTLHVCFRPDPQGQALAGVFAEGLRRIGRNGDK